MLDENFKQVKRLTSELAQASAQLNHSAGMISSLTSMIRSGAISVDNDKFIAENMALLNKVKSSVSDIEVFLSATEELASDKKPPFEMPNFFGMTQAEVTDYLNQEGITSKGEVSVRFIEKADSMVGETFRQFPPEGEQVVRSEGIQIFIGIEAVNPD